MKKISKKHVVDELAAIGFARATHFLSVSEGELTIRDTDTLSAEDQAAIASIEQTSNGVRLKFYDKMKALELLGEHLGLFGAGGRREEEDNNLLEAILSSTGEVVDLSDIQELQQTSAHCPDLVEQTGSAGL